MQNIISFLCLLNIKISFINKFGKFNKTNSQHYGKKNQFIFFLYLIQNFI